MQQETRDRERDAEGRASRQADVAQAESREDSAEEAKVTPRLSVEEHLAGLWKVLGLGD